MDKSQYFPLIHDMCWTIEKKRMLICFDLLVQWYHTFKVSTSMPIMSCWTVRTVGSLWLEAPRGVALITFPCRYCLAPYNGRSYHIIDSSAWHEFHLYIYTGHASAKQNKTAMNAAISMGNVVTPHQMFIFVNVNGRILIKKLLISGQPRDHLPYNICPNSKFSCFINFNVEINYEKSFVRNVALGIGWDTEPIITGRPKDNFSRMTIIALYSHHLPKSMIHFQNNSPQKNLTAFIAWTASHLRRHLDGICICSAMLFFIIAQWLIFTRYIPFSCGDFVASIG